MSPLLAPILAQLVTLNVGDRTEARYISAGQDESRAEASTRPIAGLNFGWERGSVLLAYTPSFTVTPLDRKPRDLLIFQAGYLTARYSWRLTSVSFSQYMGYGDLNFRVQTIADPGVYLGAAPPPTPINPAAGAGGNPTQMPGTNAPGTGTANPGSNPLGQDLRRFDNLVVHYLTWSSTVSVTHTLSRNFFTGADATYTEGRGVGASSELFPLIRGARVGGYLTHALILSRRDLFASTLNIQYGVSSTGNRSWASQLNETWVHRLDPLTTTRLGAGVSGSRLSQDDGLVAYSFYPTIFAGINHIDRLAGGHLNMGLTVSAAPFIDPLRATVDPRLTVSGVTNWTKRRFTIGASVGAAISLAQDDTQATTQGAVNSVGATLAAAYRVSDAFSVDGGITGGWQTFNGETVIPTSWTAFVGITFGSSTPLNGKGK
jgi:hypothetical protein